MQPLGTTSWTHDSQLERTAFPYRIVYYVTESDIVIVAFMHNRRGPGYWMGRIGDDFVG